MKNAAHSTESLEISWRQGVAILFIALALFLALALLSYSSTDPGFLYHSSRPDIDNMTGRVGAYTADLLFMLFGAVAYVLPLMLLFFAWRIFLRKRLPTQATKNIKRLRWFSLVLVVLSVCSLLAIHVFDPEHGAPVAQQGMDFPATAGGVIGQGLAQVLLPAFSLIGTTLFLLAIIVACFTWYTHISWLDVFEWVGVRAERAYLKLRDRAQELFNKQQAEQSRKKVVESRKQRERVIEKELERQAKREAPKIEKPIAEVKPSKRVEKEKQKPLFEQPLEGDLPRVELLDPAPPKQGGYSEETLEAMSRMLEIKLRDFNIEAEVKGVKPGPVITRFEVQPAPGVRGSKISNIAKDLARSMAVISVRVVEVIRGKTVIGIEIPNEKREMISLSEVLGSELFDQSDSPLTVALGKDISGVPVIGNLAKMPHLLVAGTTGSGKSVGVNAMLVSMLYKASPEDLRFIMVDPKMLELSVYEDIPHLLTPVVTDMNDAVTAMRWAVGEMERRYMLMSKLGVRDIKSANKKITEAINKGEPIPDPIWQPTDTAFNEHPTLEKMPYIVIVIDEFADMMMVVGKKVEELVARIAQKARAAGIHMILATQRPSSDVITGLIKANMPSRISFRVSSNIDSRVILDQTGAEQLLGNGDMLYMPVGTSIPERVHGAFLSDEEVHRVCDDWRARGQANYLEAVLQDTETGIAVIDNLGEGLTSSDAEQDELYDKAVQVVMDSGRASISMVQRRLSIGYNRAARLIEAMEEAGLVSGMQSNGKREILVPRHD
ncbi:MAG: DNA translocase FtsK 4TM domain-containing protein [Pseudomonadota bacterium]|nr:DNA translocase FtsK 4TM domain-containing protein [Pseudomonadota bacterium]